MELVRLSSTVLLCIITSCILPTGVVQFAVNGRGGGSLTEGVSARLLSGQYGIHRDNLTYAILRRARERGAVLIRAPPQVMLFCRYKTSPMHTCWHFWLSHLHSIAFALGRQDC